MNTTNNENRHHHHPTKHLVTVLFSFPVVTFWNALSSSSPVAWKHLVSIEARATRGSRYIPCGSSGLRFVLLERGEQNEYLVFLTFEGLMTEHFPRSIIARTDIRAEQEHSIPRCGSEYGQLHHLPKLFIVAASRSLFSAHLTPISEPTFLRFAALSSNMPCSRVEVPHKPTSFFPSCADRSRAFR